MRDNFTMFRFCVLAVSILSSVWSDALAQTITVQKCWTGTPTVVNGQAFGLQVGTVNFVSGVDFPAGYRVVDVQVETRWSVYNTTTGSCGGPTGAGAVSLSEVGFFIENPTNVLGVVAASANLGGFVSPPTTATWTGTTAVSGVTTTFRDGGLSPFPAAPPVNGRIYRPNGDNLSIYAGTSPFGTWRLSGVDDLLNNSALCVESFCITVTACPGNLTALCRPGPVPIYLNPSGTRSLSFADINNGSDTSCFLRSVSFSPNNFTCAQVGSTIPVTMSLEDRLGNSAGCATSVQILDTIGPTINCRNYTAYLNASGLFILNAADSVLATDNCGVVTRRVNGVGNFTYNCLNIGLNNLTLSASDAHGNTRSCPVTINILDTFPPTPICRDTTIYLNAVGEFDVDASVIDGGSFDVCPPILTRLINGVPTFTFICVDLGTRQTFLTVGDAYGNESECIANVTVLDTLPPVAICRTADTLYLDNSGSGTVTANRINNGSTDNCTASAALALTLNGAASVNYTCANLGLQPVVLTVRDGSNNVSTCNSTVLVLDTIRPRAFCRTATAFVNNAGVAVVPASAIDNGSNDVCTAVSLSINGQPSINFDCTQLNNPQFVTLTVRDSSGNVDNCMASVIVQDTTRPIARCRQNVNVFVNAAGVVNVTAATIDSTSSDNCGVSLRTINGLTSFNYNCAQVGTPQNAILRITDASNNFAECTAVINVRDTIPPTAICRDLAVNLGAGGTVSVAASSLNNGSTDNCGAGGLTFLVNGQPSINFNCNQTGANTVTLTVRDASGNTRTCSSVITVTDNTPPTAICNNVLAYVNAVGNVTITAPELRAAASSDNCSILSATINGSGSVLYNCDSLEAVVGPRQARLELRDPSGNIGSCISNITIRDTIAPTAICDDITVNLSAGGLAVVYPNDIRNNSSLDNCGITTASINGLDSVVYTCANFGINPVTLTLTDASGNSATCTADVNVVDLIAPVAACFSQIEVFLSPTGTAPVVAASLDSASTDNCISPILTINNQASFTYNCTDLGSNTATLRVTDASGNSDVCQTTVVVRDTTPPVARCRSSLTVFINAGTVTLLPAQLDSLSNDNCGIVNFNLNGSPSRVFNCANLGNNTVRLNVRDAAGNTNFCETVVQVLDTTRPTIACNTRTVHLNPSGTITISPNSPVVLATAADNCGTPTLTFGASGTTRTFDCTAVGTTQNLTIRATDASNNFRECVASVNVLDTVRPTAQCLNPTVNLNAAGIAVITAPLLDGGSFDACGIASRAISRDTFRCSDVGQQAVTLTITDVHGNIATCISQVTVQESTPPIAQCRSRVEVFLSSTTGTATLLPNQVDSLSSDNCGIVSYLLNGASSIAYTCSDVGNNSVTLEVQDASGNTASCNNTLVVVRDTTPPNLVCQGQDAFINNAGTVTVNAAAPLVVSATDNCGSPNLRFLGGATSRTFDCTQIGIQTLVIEAVDAANNLSTCTVSLNVRDTIRPQALCQTNPSLALDASGLLVLSPANINAGSTDNCSGFSLSLSRDTFRCADVGLQPVTLTMTDLAGNQATCISQVTVRDSIPPRVLCRTNLDVFLVGGTANLTVAQVDSSSSDICGLSSLLINGQTNLNFTCAQVGPNIVRLVVTDNNGNRDSCTSVVNVRDTIAPVITCTPITVNLSALGQATVTAATLATATDNCTTNPSVQIQGSGNSRTFTCNDVGQNTLTMVATDAGGNTATCPVQVTIRDLTPPTANCRNLSLALDASGRVTVPVLDFDNGSNDACGIVSYVASPAVLSCANIGPNNVTLTVTDPSGNQRSCTATITVTDTAAPTAICRDTTVFVSSAAPSTAIVTPQMINGGSFDSCGIAAFTINGASNVLFTCNQLGNNQVTLQVRDNSNNISSCQATVTVVDTVAPQAICFNRIVAFVDASGIAVVTPARLDSASRDNCALNIAGFSINGQPTASYTCAAIGNLQTATLRVLDVSGNQATCTTQIEVRDTVAPVANCFPGPLNFTLTGTPATVVVNATALGTGTDNCGPVSYTINGQNSFTYNCSSAGLNTAILGVIDAYGNQSTCNATLNIRDLTPPNAGCRNLIVQLDSTGLIRVPAISLNNNSTDNCGIVGYQVSGQDTVLFNCLNIGQNTLTLSVRDASGNVGTCNSIVTVQDNRAPVARCFANPIPAFIANNGAVIVPASAVDSASSDNCGIVSRTFSGGAPTRQFTCNNLGNNNVVVTFADAAGNVASCNAVIQVRDTTPPVANCQSITVTLNNAGQATVNAISLNNPANPSTDNCNIATYRINGQASISLNCTNVGQNPITLTVSDASGNTSTCVATVTVVDNIPPVLNCASNATFFVNAAGQAVVTPAQVATATDVCSVVSLLIDGQASRTFTCANIPVSNQVVITATDPSGNQSSCQVNINLRDTIRPVAQCRSLNLALNNNGEIVVTANQLNNLSQDNCAITQFLINGQPTQRYTCANLGNNTAILTVRDSSGNQSTCLSQVIIRDTIPPTITCPTGLTVPLGSNGVVVVQAASLNNGTAADPCGPLTFLLNGQTAQTYTCANVGTNPATLVVADASNNQTACPVSIIIIDTLAPLARCRDLEVFLNNNGFVQVNATQLDAPAPNASFDNCGISNYRINGASFVFYDCSAIQSNPNLAILRVEDVYGNTDTCHSFITVRDTTPPAVVCQNLIINLSTNGQRQLTPADLDPGRATNDACGIDSMYVLPALITCDDLGDIPVTLYAIDVNGNIDSCTAIATVILDRPSASGNSPLCEGQTFDLFANPPASGLTYTYAWSGPNNFNSTQENPSISNVTGANAGDYILTITPTNGTGCPARDTVRLDINTVPPPVLAASNISCENGPAFIFLQNRSDYNGVNINYQWFFNGQALSINNDTLNFPSLDPNNAGDYVLTIEVDGCRDSNFLNPFNFVVNTLPPAPQPSVNNPCEGETLSLMANPQDTANRSYTYRWSGPFNFTASVANPNASPVVLALQGLFTVTVTDGNGCTASASVQANIRPRPNLPSLLYNQPLCLDDLLELTDTTTYPSNPLTYFWGLPDGSNTTTNQGQLILNDALAGPYTLEVDMNGCRSAQATLDVAYEAQPLAQDDAFNLPFRDSLSNIPVIANDSLPANGFSIDIVTQANNGTVINNANGTFDYRPNFNFFGRDSFRYVICDVLCPNSCDTALVILDVTTDFECFIPNALSPNGDGINDELNIRCVHEYPNAKIQIFSRWGTLVYEGAPRGFNGQFRGQDLPDGTYFYVLELNDRTHVANDRFSGFIVIQR